VNLVFQIFLVSIWSRFFKKWCNLVIFR